MNKVIKINNCSNCPYSDSYFKSVVVEEKQLSKQVSLVTKTKYMHYYHCNELDGKSCQNEYNEYSGIPEWCPLENE